jgi:3-methyladenine DNA glycosylase AlkC
MKLMKNGLAEPAIRRIASALSQALTNNHGTVAVVTKTNKTFSEQSFIKQALYSLDTLELKERVSHIIEIIHLFMPNDFVDAVPLLKLLLRYWDYGDKEDPLRGFAAWPIIDYIAVYGINHVEVSLDALQHLTELFSAEFAIRPFIIKYPDYCHQQFLLWAKSENEHLRRLVSEGTRPRLPWGIQLKTFIKDPRPNIPLLTLLKDDGSLYVRRSVANHLNDMSKDNSKIMIATCKKWQADLSTKQKSSDKNHFKEQQDKVDWIIKHASRGLIKAGNKHAFSLLGFTDQPAIKASKLNLSSQNIKMNETLIFELILSSDADVMQEMVVDYAIHFTKANGKTKLKVFKLKNVKLNKGEKITLNKNYHFKPITTRKYYSGDHTLDILVNGEVVASADFELHV